MTLRLGLAGDVMLGRLVDDRQRHRSVTAVWGDTLARLRSLDGLCINLECCLSTRGRQWRHTRRPFHFRARPDWAIPALETAGVDCCALANNHVLDFEEPALLDTLDNLAEAGIAYAGAGRTESTALEPAFVTVGETLVAVVSLTDNTPEYAATATTPGTAYVEIDVENPETRRTVETALGEALARDPDLLVTSLHWGPNMETKPPEQFRQFAHWLVDEGVDVVYGHSAHVFQGVELYDGRPICYDTGDFVDDYAVDQRLRNDRSFLFELSLTPSGSLQKLRLHPTEIVDCAVHEADEAAAAWSRERMRDLSAPFGTTFDRAGETLVCSLGR